MANHTPSVARYPDEVRETAVKLYAVDRNIHKVGKTLGIHFHVIADWRKQEWFQERLKEIEIEFAAQLSGNLRAVTDDAIGITKKRLEQGDAFFDKKTGKWLRKEISGKDAAKIATSFIDAIQKIEKPIREQQIQADTKNTLDKLAEQFTLFASEMKKIQKPIVNVTDVIEVVKE